MLSWVGKRPLSRVRFFPAQHVETFGDVESGERRLEHWAKWPTAYPKGGLLFHGDNKEVLGHLLASGFRGQVDLIYIDPPFDSGADYVRKVSLRGEKESSTIEGEPYTLGEQIQYTDIWANDNYLQFMYERLMLLKELLTPSGVIILHCDWKKSHHLRVLLDEIFGSECFRNEIYWYFYNKMHDVRKEIFPRATNTLLVYAKGDHPVFHRLAVPRHSVIKQLKRVKVDGVLVNLKDEDGNLVYQDSDARTLDNVWPIPLIPAADVRQKTDYPTQKPEALLEMAILTYTNPGGLVLDAFVGSGTTCVAAQRLGRRWIGADINKGAIHTSSKRLQTEINEQKEAAARPEQVDALSDAEPRPPQAQLSFTTWRVNDYDLAIQHNEAVNLACEKLGVERKLTDTFFDGTLGKRLVKIVPFSHALNPVDLEEIKRELAARPDEDRPVAVVALGVELAAQAWVGEWNRLRRGRDAVNRFEVIDLRSDPTHGGIIKHEPATARVSGKRTPDGVAVEIEDFISPSVVARLREQTGVLKPKLDDWRAMVDCVLIDSDFNGQTFQIALSDIPVRKSDLVVGSYSIKCRPGNVVAVKIVDMLGEEILITRNLVSN